MLIDEQKSDRRANLADTVSKDDLVHFVHKHLGLPS